MNRIMPSDLKQKLEEISKKIGGDPEMAHLEMDDLLVETLESLGYDLKAYKDQWKWYA